MSKERSSWKLERQKTERLDREAKERKANIQMARLHASALHGFQVLHATTAPQGEDGEEEERRRLITHLDTLLAPPATPRGSSSSSPTVPTAAELLARQLILIELKSGEANHRQVLLLTTEDDDQMVLKTCATDSWGDVYLEHLTGTIARRLGVSVPLVHATRHANALSMCIERLQGSGFLVSHPSESLQPSLWAAPHLSTPFTYIMAAAKGKTLLELKAHERRRLVPQLVLPAIGRLIALDALVNNWDRWPVHTLWQKNREYVGKSEDELRRAFRPLRGSEDFEECEGEEEEEAELQEPMLPEDLLRSCGCNLGNVLFHPQSSAVVSIDTCVITGAPNDYPNKLLALIEEVVRAQEANAECDGLRVTRAVLTAALRLDDATRPGGSCSLLEQSALLQLGFLEGIEKAAQRLGPKELGGLIKRTRAHAELRGEEEASPLPLLPMSAADGLTRQLEEARKLVERTVAACATRQERVRACLLESSGSAAADVRVSIQPTSVRVGIA